MAHLQPDNIQFINLIIDDDFFASGSELIIPISVAAGKVIDGIFTLEDNVFFCSNSFKLNVATSGGSDIFGYHGYFFSDEISNLMTE
jgi:hypothetical protein